MANFIIDNPPLPDLKVNTRPLRPTERAINEGMAEDINGLWAALGDTRSYLLSGAVGSLDNFDHVIYAGPSGDDANDGHDSGHAVASLDRAFQLLPQAHRKTSKIILTGDLTLDDFLTANVPKAVGPDATPCELVAPWVNVIADRAMTGSTASTITDTGITRTTDDLKGMVLRFTTGTATGARYQILANTAHQITCIPFAGAPTAGDHYVVEKYGATVNHQGAQLGGANAELVVRGVKLVNEAAPWRVGGGLKMYLVGSVADLGGGAMIADPGGVIAGGGPNDDYYCGGYIFNGDVSSGVVADVGGRLEIYLSFKNTGVLVFGRMLVNYLDATNCLIDVQAGQFENDGAGHVRTKGVVIESFSTARLSSLDISGVTGDGLTVKEGSYVSLTSVTGSSNSGHGINCSADSRVQFVSGVTLTGDLGDIVLNGTTYAYGVLTGISDITGIGGGTDDGFEHAAVVGDSSQAGGGSIDGTDDAAAVRTALYAAGDYNGTSFTTRFATRAGTAMLKKVPAGKSIRMDTGAIFPTTQGGASGSGPVSLRFRGLLGDSPIKPNVGASADCLGMTMSPSVEWTQTFWEDTMYIGRDRSFGSGADCDSALHVSTSGGGGQHNIRAQHLNGVYCKTSGIHTSGGAQFRVQDIKNSGSQIYNGLGNSSILFADQVGNWSAENVYDYGESGYAGTDNATGSADMLIRIDPSSASSWKGTRISARNLICGARTSNMIYCYPTHGAATAEQIHVEQFYQQVTNGTMEISNAQHVSLARGCLDASAVRNVMNLFSVAHATLREVTSNSGFEPTVTLDGGHLEVIDTPLKSATGSPCGVFPPSAVGAANCYVTTSGARHHVRRAQAAIVQYTLTKWGATDNRIDQLGTGDAAWLAAGIADQTLATNDYGTQLEQDGQPGTLKSDGSTTLAPGDLITASGASAGRGKKTTKPGDVYVAECISTVAASADALISVIWRRGVVGIGASSSIQLGHLGVGTAANGSYGITTTLDTLTRGTIYLQQSGSIVDSLLIENPSSGTAHIYVNASGNPLALGANGNVDDHLVLKGDGHKVGIGVTKTTVPGDNIAAWLHVKQAAQTGTPDPIARWDGGAHTSGTAGTEIWDVNLNLARTVTWLNTGAPSNITIQRAIVVQAPTYNFATNTGTPTIRNACVMYFDQAPVAGGNAVITNAFTILSEGNVGLGSPFASGSTTGGDVASPKLIFSGAAHIDGSHHTAFSGTIQGVTDGVGTGGLQFTGSLGFFGGTPHVQTSVAGVLVNSVTSGGSTSVIADVTDITTYSNAGAGAAIRNNLYQLAKKVLALETALRNYSMVVD